MRAIFMGALQAFGLCRVVVSNVVHLVAGVQSLDGFERADLAAARGGMQEVGLDPKDLHVTSFKFRVSSCK